MTRTFPILCVVFLATSFLAPCFSQAASVTAVLTADNHYGFCCPKPFSYAASCLLLKDFEILGYPFI